MKGKFPHILVASYFMLVTLPLPLKGEILDGRINSQEVQIQNSILAVAGAELEVSPIKITKSVKWTMNFLNPISLEQRKENLLQSLCRETGADIIIDPQFSYTKYILGGGKLILTGYPAKYKKFRSLTDNEIDSLIFNKPLNQEKVIFINR